MTIENGGVRSLPRPGEIPTFQDDVQRLDAQLGLETDRWGLVVRGSNILDEDYQTWTFGTNPTRRAWFYRRVDPRYYSLESPGVFVESRLDLLTRMSTGFVCGRPEPTGG